MTKKLAKRNLISMAILTALILVLCFINISVPATNSRFVGFANAIQTDIDIAGGYAADYSVTFREGETDKETVFKETIELINNKLVAYGYGSASVSYSGLDNVHVEVPDLKLAEEVLEAIGVDGDLYIRTSETTTVEETDLTADDITDIVSMYGQISASEFNWGVSIEFSEEGKSKIKSLTEGGSGTLYIYVGDEVYSKVSFNQQIKDNSIFIYGSTQDQESTDIYALNLLIAKQTVGLSMINNQITQIAPTLGDNALLFACIAILIIMAVFIALMFIKFGELGYIALLSLGLVVGLTLFFMQAVPIFILSFSGIIGAVLGLAIFFASIFVIFSKIQKGYAEGKKIPLAIRLGFKNTTLTIVDICVLVIMASVGIYFLGGVVANSFAFALALTTAISMFATLVLTRLYAKWYSVINSTNAKKLNMTREANVDELN